MQTCVVCIINIITTFFFCPFSSRTGSRGLPHTAWQGNRSSRVQGGGAQHTLYRSSINYSAESFNETGNFSHPNTNQVCLQTRDQASFLLKNYLLLGSSRVYTVGKHIRQTKEQKQGKTKKTQEKQIEGRTVERTN